MAIYTLEYIDSHYGVQACINEAVQELNQIKMISDITSITESGVSEAADKIKTFIQRIVAAIRNFFSKFIQRIKEKIDKIIALREKKKHPVTYQLKQNRRMTSEERKNYNRINRVELDRFVPSYYFADKCIDEIENSVELYNIVQLNGIVATNGVRKYIGKSKDEIVEDSKLDGSSKSKYCKKMYEDCIAGKSLPGFLTSMQQIENDYNKTIKYINSFAEKQQDSDSLDQVIEDVITAAYNVFLANCEAFNRDVDAYTKACQITLKYTGSDKPRNKQSDFAKQF